MDKLSIGTNIRLLRRSQGITQAQLSQGIGVSYQTVSKWETETTCPDVASLPQIADFFGVSIDELFRGPAPKPCGRPVPPPSSGPPEADKDFLLHTYAQCYGPEAGPWNLSVENKYLEYRFARFFEDHFPIRPGDGLCNIGIGAGAWDRYLAYRLQGGKLTSIDIDPLACRQLRQGLAFEENPNAVTVVCADVMALEFREAFHIVTMVGSTKIESGAGLRIVAQAMSFVKRGGGLFYQSLDPMEDPDAVIRLAHRQNMAFIALERKKTESFSANYYCFRKL